MTKLINVVAEVEEINEFSSSIKPGYVKASNLTNVLIDAVQILKESGIDFCLVGGFAIGVHSQPRATKDVDFLILSLPETKKVLEQQGFTQKETYTFDKVSVNKFIKDSIDVDLLVMEKQEYARKILQRAKATSFGPENIKVISVEDLIILKALANRKKDYWDIEHLKEHNNLIDWDYIKKEMKSLGIIDRLWFFYYEKP